MDRARLLAVSLAALLALPVLAQAQVPVEVGSDDGRGRLVHFQGVRFNDTLFAGLEPTYRVTFDEAGDLWYATQAGVVHVDVDDKVRRLHSRPDGLASSYVLAVVTSPGKVYAATDLGLSILDRATDTWTNFHTWDSPLPDSIVRELAIDGKDLWIGTHFGGLIVLDTETLEWSGAKNTSTRADYPKPVRRIFPTPTEVWVGTDGDGVWRLDRATGQWSVLLRSDGLVSNTVLGIAKLDNATWFGTDRGIQRRDDATGALRTYNRTHGMPHEIVQDLDVLPTVDGPDNLFASTRSGVWQLDPATGGNARYAQEFGILGEIVLDQTWIEEHGWVFASTRGISLLRDEAWTYYTTGPSSGASSGPMAHRFTAAYSGNSAPFLWFGTDFGISAFLPAAINDRGVWYNFGEWQHYPAGVVNAIDVEGNTTWVASNTGVVGYDIDAGVWRDLSVTGSRNLVYGVDVHNGEIWIPLFGDGLIMRNLTTGLHRTWTYQTAPEPIPDQFLTDVRVHGDEVWLGASIGLIRMSRTTGTFLGTYTIADGLPSSGVVFRVLPDGNSVWVGMKDGGVARLQVANGKVDRVWNATNVPGFPEGEASEVRSLLREGGRLWAGTKGGLVRIDVTTGQARVFNQTNSDLVQDFVNGIAEQDGILYLATASGVARFDIAEERFLPLHDSEDAQVIGTGGGAGVRASPVSVRIDAPRDGTGVTGVVEIRGAATRFGGRIDAVEVRIGQGEWQPAQGGEFWTFTWDTSSVTPEQPITIAARARSGNDTSRVSEILVTPVALPTIPLEMEHQPVATASALRSVLVAAKVTGDEPLTAAVYYKVPGGDVFKRLPMQRQGALFTASIPGSDVREGTLQYYVEARSGAHLAVTAPEDPHTPHRITVGPPPSLAVDVRGPDRLTARAGETTRVVLNVTNVGSEAATFVVRASGLRSSWLTVPDEPLALQPGESREVAASLAVPREAFSANTTLTFDVRDAGGVAEAARAVVPVEVLAAQGGAAPTPTTGGAGRGIPALGLVGLLAGVAVALAARRWRS